MEGQSNKDNGGTSNNDVSNPKSVIPAYERSGDQLTICLPEPFRNYVEYLSESSTYLPNTSTTTTTTTNEHLIGSSYLPFGRNFFHNEAAKSSPFKPIIASSSNADDYEIRKRVGFWRPNEEREEGIKVEIETSENRLYAEGHAEWKADSSNGDKHNAASRSTWLPKLGSSSSKHKAAKIRDTDRQRRQRISDNLKALHELLPNPDQEDSQAYILDDIIDYVKYLQLQVKELSGSRLQADSNAIPLVFHEGYGHYIDQQMLNEPLEEIMGKLLEEHSGAANQLLESKGLFLMPIALVDELNEAMQMFSGTA